MQDFQARVMDEKEQLDAKLDKLESFLGTDTFNALSTEEKHLIRKQADLMDCYSLVLGKRIELFRSRDKALV